jgi:DNA-binding NarL/FixJ family response regulator
MPKSVLIVDDSHIVRTTIRDYLEALTDWKIGGEAENGVEAIQKATEIAADLILLDFSMAKMNGLEAAAMLKRTSPDALVVMFTMFDKALGSNACPATGVDLVISKSDGLINLVQSVNRLLEDRMAPVDEPRR